MKKLIIALCVAIGLPVMAQSDKFNKTNWKPFTNNAPVEFATLVTVNYTYYRDSKSKFTNSFEGFARYKVDNEYVYNLFVIDCEQHMVSLWTQDSQHIRSEYINPSHPVWWYRNTICKKG
jgi:hypothetical protein